MIRFRNLRRSRFSRSIIRTQVFYGISVGILLAPRSTVLPTFLRKLFRLSQVRQILRSAFVAWLPSPLPLSAARMWLGKGRALCETMTRASSRPSCICPSPSRSRVATSVHHPQFNVVTHDDVNPLPEETVVFFTRESITTGRYNQQYLLGCLYSRKMKGVLSTRNTRNIDPGGRGCPYS